MTKNNLIETEKLEQWRKFGLVDGYVLLSTEYINIKTKLKWQDADGDIFEITPDKIISRGWPKSKKISKDKLEYWRKIGFDFGYDLLSTKYYGMFVDLEWKNKKTEEIVFRSPYKINLSSFPKTTVEILLEIKNFGFENGYELLSTEYINSSTNLLWRDKNGIIFEKTLAVIKQCGWPKVHTNYLNKQISKKEHLFNLKQIAENRGGKLISSSYINEYTKLEFEDANGNTFLASPSDIKKGNWTPHDRHAAEYICRQAFEFIFKCKMPLANIIKNKNGKNYQLDGYNECVIINNTKYQIAFEYQGHQKHREDAATMARDKYKTVYCENNNILLFVVDPFDTKFKYNTEYIIDYILKIINKKIKVEAPNETFIIDFTKLNNNKIMFEEWKQFGMDNGYELLSTEYINTIVKLKWMRKTDGFIFYRSPQVIKNNGWLKEGSLSMQQSLTKEEHYEQLKQLLEIHNCTIITKQYINCKQMIEFSDINGAVHKMRVCKLRQKTWIKQY